MFYENKHFYEQYFFNSNAINENYFELICTMQSPVVEISMQTTPCNMNSWFYSWALGCGIKEACVC